MGFTFRYETLRKVRSIKENMAQQRFSQAQRHYINLENLKNLRITAKNDVQKELKTRMKSGLKSSQMKQYYDYLAFLEEAIQQLDKNLAAAQKELDDKREQMLSAKREHKAIERLKELDEERYISEQNRKEMCFIDEMAILRHGGNQ